MTMRMVSKNSFNRTVAAAEVSTLPGCSQVAVIHGSLVEPESRGKGEGYHAHRRRLADLHNDYLYDVAIATVAVDNTAQMKIMKKAGWTKVSEFKSRRTGNNVALFTIDLYKVAEF